MLRAALAGLLACHGPSHPNPPRGGEPVTGSPTTTTPTTVEVALADAGFVVGEGAFVVSDMSGCCDPGVTCWGNNPSTPYGTPLVPLAPGAASELADDLLVGFGPVPPGLSRTFQLRPDEVMITLGTLPPASRYFSFRSYLAARPDVDTPIVGSLGASLNHLVIEAERGSAPVWGQPVAILTSFDASIEARARDALVAAGWDPRHVHADRITGSVVWPGLDPGSDSFFALVRSGLFDDPDAGAAWRAAPDLRVLRATPAVEQSWDEPWPWPDLPARGTGVPEPAALAAAQQRLLDAVVAAHPGHAAEVLPTEPYWHETVACAAAEDACTGDIRDRYAATLQGLLLGPDDAIAVLGVNHAATGKAVYSSAAVQTVVSQRGIAALESPDMPGSAAAWLPGDPLADTLYTWWLARDCAGWPDPCYPVPTACPGVPLDEPLKLTVRAYLEPATGAAPLDTELVTDVAVRLVPAP